MTGCLTGAGFVHVQHKTCSFRGQKVMTESNAESVVKVHQ